MYYGTFLIDSLDSIWYFGSKNYYLFSGIIFVKYYIIRPNNPDGFNILGLKASAGHTIYIEWVLVKKMEEH